VIEELDTHVTFDTDTPPLMESVAPDTKFDPETVTVVVEPRANEGGFALVTVGPGSTVKHPVQVPLPPSGLVMVTLINPGEAAEATEIPTDR
jgi:hypothetical protein